MATMLKKHAYCKACHKDLGETDFPFFNNYEFTCGKCWAKEINSAFNSTGLRASRYTRIRPKSDPKTKSNPPE